MTFTASGAYKAHAIELHTPYHPSFVGTLKRAVPHRYREWRPERKVWIVREPYAGLAEDLLLRAFPGAVVQRPGRPTARPFTLLGGGAGDPDRRALFVTDDAPAEVVDAAYKALARVHHPDRGGDTATMQKLNAAYDRVQSRQRREAS